MSTGGQRRPLRVSVPGKRVVLVIPRAEPGSHVVATLDAIAGQGWTVSAIIDPEQHLDALRMVVSGLADVVVAVHPDHMPSLKFAPDLPSGRDGGRRTTRVLRSLDGTPASHPRESAMHRRPRPVDQLPVEPPFLPEPVAAEPQIAQGLAHLPAAPIPASRRASQSHRSGSARRRRT